MKYAMLKIGLLALALATAVACNKKSADGASVQNARDQRAAGGMGGALPYGQGTAGGASGTIMAQNNGQLTQLVRTLMSPIMSPESIGDVLRIEVSGNVLVQNNGQITPDSAIQLVIYDTLAGRQDPQTNEVIQPIMVRLRGNSTGTAYNGQVNMTFSDEYGSITVTGTWNMQNFIGNVSFANKSSGSGTLGQFSVSTCAFFRCMQ